MPTIEGAAPYATFINVSSVAPEEQDEVVRILVRLADEVASKFPGFVSASTHKSGDDTHIFNYLQWRSAGDLASMQRSPEFQVVAGGLQGKLLAFEEYVCQVAHVKEAALASGTP